MTEPATQKAYEPSVHLVGLDGLRGMAAIMVVFHHLGQHLRLAHGFHHGYLSVPFFFVLSGFVIARSYEERLATTLSFRRFVEIRVIRLFPMMWLGALLAVILGLHPLFAPLAMLALPAFFLDSMMFPANPPEWSLFFELVGNGLHARLCRYLTNTVLIVLIAICTAGLTVFALKAQSVSIGWLVRTSAGGAFLFGACYLIGVGIHRLHRAGRLPAIRVPFLVLPVAMAISMTFPQADQSAAFAIRDLFCALIVFPIIVVLAIDAPVPARLVPLCALVGELSYPLYMIHDPIVIAVATRVRAAPPPLWIEYLLCVGVVLGCLAAAWLLLTWYDRPVRARLSAIFALRRRQPSAGPA